MLGKLDGVVHQIDQYLPQPQGIPTQEDRHLRRFANDHLHIFALSQIGKHARQRVELLAKIEVYLLQRQLVLLHLGQIKDVVDKQ